jgi:hypothetical protein
LISIKTCLPAPNGSNEPRFLGATADKGGAIPAGAMEKSAPMAPGNLGLLQAYLPEADNAARVNG